MDIWPLCRKVGYKPQTVAGRTGMFYQTQTSAGDTTCIMNATRNLGWWYVVLLWAVLLPRKTFNHGTYCLKCEWGIKFNILLLQGHITEVLLSTEEKQFFCRTSEEI